MVKSGKHQTNHEAEAQEAGPAGALACFNVNHYHHESTRLQ